MLAELFVWQHQAIVDVLQNYQSRLDYISVLLVLGSAYLLVKENITKLRPLGYLAAAFAICTIICQHILYAETIIKLAEKVPESGSTLLAGNFLDMNYLGTWFILSFIFNLVSFVFLALFAALGGRK